MAAGGLRHYRVETLEFRVYGVRVCRFKGFCLGSPVRGFGV